MTTPTQVLSDEQREAIRTGINAMKTVGWTHNVPVLESLLTASAILTVRTVRAALIAQHGFCLDEDQCTCARELGYRVCQPSDHTSHIGEDAANGAMGEREALRARGFESFSIDWWPAFTRYILEHAPAASIGDQS